MPETRGIRTYDIRSLLRDAYTGRFVYKELPTRPDVVVVKEVTGVSPGVATTLVALDVGYGSILRITKFRFNVEGSGAKGKAYVLDLYGTLDIIFLEAEGSEKQEGAVDRPVYVAEGTFITSVLSYGTAYTYGIALEGYYCSYL